MSEVWKPIKGWKGLYEVSNLGRVRSLPRVIVRSNGAPQTVRGRLLTKGKAANGYVAVKLSSPNKQRDAHVHVLVAEAFLKKPAGTDRVCHKDDVGSNNRLKNLYWGNASTNGRDAYRNGKHETRVYKKGTDVYNAIPDKKAVQILRLRKEGFLYTELVKRCRVSRDTVIAVCSGKGRFKTVGASLREAISDRCNGPTGRTKHSHSYLKRAAEKRSKQFRLIDPTGKVFVGRNLKAFCIKRGLQQSCMAAVCAGLRQSHKQWTGEYV